MQIDGWLLDSVDEAVVDKLESDGIRCRAVPLWMTDVGTTNELSPEPRKPRPVPETTEISSL